jgi:uncharacterized OB-fold protein
MGTESQSLFIPSRIMIPFNYAAGAIASRFFVELRDHRKILGKRCPQCTRVIVPPQKFCLHCFTATYEWVEVGPTGTLVNFTVVQKSEAHHPRKAPFAYGVIQLDGADSNLVHFLGEINLDHIQLGMRLQAVFKEERVGNILDIAYFKPEDSESPS